MESSFRLIRVRGIEIGVNWSWLLIFGVMVWSLATQVFPFQHDGLSRAAYWGMAIAGAVLFVASLLLHELGHAFRAIKEGMVIEGITLWLFGGVAKFKGMFPSAGAEFRIAVAGPVVTLVLFAVFEVLQRLGTAVGAPVAIIGVLQHLSYVNGILFVFNMLPGLPLDGGRVLRSYLWHRSGNFTAATMSAARIARVMAGLLIGLGALLALGTGSFGGLWIAFIGYFLMQAAQAEVAYALFRQSLRGLTVADLMTPNPEVVDPDTTIQSFLENLPYLRGYSTYPVVEDGRLDGLISLRIAATVPLEERAVRRVRDVMLSIDQVPTVRVDEDIVNVVQQMQQGAGRALVVDDGHVAGILSMADIARAIELEQVRSGPVPGAARTSPWLWIITTIIGIGILAWFYAPPFVVLAPGVAFDVTNDIKIEGMELDDVDGGYLLTSVSVQQPNVYGLAFGIVQGREIAPLSALLPPGEDPDEYFREQEALFRETQTIAAAAAARAAGLDVELKGGGALIGRVEDEAPADGVLEAGDIVTEINGTRIRFAEDMVRAIRSRPAGTSFELVVERDGKEETVTVRSRAGVIGRAPGIGVQVTTHELDFDLPFEVTFRQREIGGPSAGLAYALAVYDLIESSDLAGGRDVAATGEIDPDGNVGQVGGVEEKAIAAQRAGAELFLVPEQEVDLVDEDVGLDVLGVATLEEAIDALRR